MLSISVLKNMLIGLCSRMASRQLRCGFRSFNDQLEFIYILEWPDETTMRKQWEAFMADAEWENIKQQSREQYSEMVLGKLKDQVLQDTGWFKDRT